MRFLALVILAFVVLGAGFWWLTGTGSTPARPDIAFAPLVDEDLADPDNPTKTFRMDLARVEHEVPLSRADRDKLTIENLKTLSQEELDQVYARLTAGPIPDGAFQGAVLFAHGDSLRSRIGEVLGGLPGRIADTKLDGVERVAETLWKGKVFDRDQRVLRNYIEDLQPLRFVIEDTSTLETAWVPRGGLLGRVIPRTEVWLLFPAKLYCGQSLVDNRRESIIIDYAFNDELPGFRPEFDAIAGRNALDLRDEVRMVRPGLYLGRAYMNRAFVLNFILYSEALDEEGREAFLAGEPIAEDCWPGEQTTVAAR